MLAPILPAVPLAAPAAPAAAPAALKACITFRFAANSAILAIRLAPLPISQKAASTSNPAITLSMFPSSLIHCSAAARSCIAFPMVLTMPLSLCSSFFPASSSFPAAASMACTIRSKKSSMSFSSCARSASSPLSTYLIRSSRIRCAFPTRSSVSFPMWVASKLSRNAFHVSFSRSILSARLLISPICSSVIPSPSKRARLSRIVPQSFSRSITFVARFSPKTSPAAFSRSS